MKKVFLLITRISFSLLGQAGPVLLSVKNTPVTRHEKALKTIKFSKSG